MTSDHFLRPSNSLPIPRLFPWVASLLYMGTLFTGIYYNAAGLCSGQNMPSRILHFTSGIAALLILEQFARRYATVQSSRWLPIGFLLGRMFLFEVVAAVDCSDLSRALFPIIPFVAYFSFGRKASYGLVLFYICEFLVKLWLFVPAWYLHREYISDLLMFFIAIVFAVSMAIMAGEAEANRRRAEQFLSDLLVSHQKLKVYAGQVAVLAAAEERNRLARDIHDSLGHHLTTISVLLEKALTFQLNDPHEANQALQDARRLTREALQDVRQSVGALRQSGEVFSLSTALAELVRNMHNEQLGINLEITGNDESAFSKTALKSLYRATQEALTNIQKHARARNVNVQVTLDRQAASLSVVDDGLGFDTRLLEQLSSERSERFGLQGIRERLELTGGFLKVESTPGHGTHFTVTIPSGPSEPGQIEVVAGVLAR